MIPAPPTGKPRAFYDTECFANYWLLKIRPEHGPAFSFSLRSGESFDRTTIERIDYLFSIFTVISFNGNYYDVPMIGAALSGYTCEQLKWLSNQIIVEDRKPWELGIGIEWKPADHIDIMEVLPGAGSQKQYAGRIHCKTMQDLPYPPDSILDRDQILKVDSYCEHDLSVLEELFNALTQHLHLREQLSKKYGIDLRSKSDAQVGELIIKLECERLIGNRIYKPEIDWNIRFRYDAPDFLSFQYPEAKAAFELIKEEIFTLGPSGNVVMPPRLEGLEIPLGKSIYRLGIGGLHSSEKREAHFSDEANVIRDYDVASYYPNLILNSGEFPPALGPNMLRVYAALKDQRLEAKSLEKKLKKAGDTTSPEYLQAHSDNEGGKVAINGPFGKLGSPFSVLFAPKMLIQTTVTGQLALLMLIEWHELQGIPVISANTDGVVIKCPREKLPVTESILRYWEKKTGLEMETTEYKAIYSRDVNNYFAIKATGEVKRKGEYSTAGLIEKKNPNVEICGDALAEFLSKGTPLIYSIASCRDIRKFVRTQQVAGGAVKLWGEGPRKGMKVADMAPTLQANGWIKAGRKWTRGEILTDATSAYNSCFAPQAPEYLGKVIRWYYSTQAPGSIIYNSNANTVGNSYGGRPCMTLPDEFPADIDYQWYFDNCQRILHEIGYFDNGRL